MKLNRTDDGMTTFKDAISKFPDDSQLRDAYEKE